MRQISALGLALIGIFAFLCLGGIGALCALAVAPAMTNEANDIADMPTTPDVATGEEAALTGTLTGNTAITSDPEIDQIADYKVVAYNVERYTRSTSGTGKNRRTTNRWEKIRTVMNTLKMEVGGTPVTFYGKDNVKLDGDMHSFQEGTTITSGDLRVIGFRDGDQVTVVGKRMGDGQFMIDQMYGGTRDDLVANTRLAAKVFRYLGFGSMVCGGLVAIGLLGTAVLLVYRKKPDAPPPAGPSMWPPVTPPPTFPPASS